MRTIIWIRNTPVYLLMTISGWIPLRRRCLYILLSKEKLGASILLDIHLIQLLRCLEAINDLLNVVFKSNKIADGYRE
jgi:hypothetical protein